MKKYECPRLIGIWLLCLFLASCEEKFEIDIPDNVADGIVFSGIISNASPPYFFHLTKPAPIMAELYSYEGIEDATVVIEDVTAGIKDTLQLVEPHLVEYVGVVYYYYNYCTQKNEDAAIHRVDVNQSHGVYMTTKIYGIEGHTYALDIYYKGVHHTAKETMFPKTKMTDLKLKEFDLGEKGQSWAPCISFLNQPEVENYYLFFIDRYSTFNHPVSSLSSLFRGSDYWSYSILSDEHLGDKVVDLVVSDGEDVRGLPPGAHYPGARDSIFVTMQSISKACYDIYDKTIEQVRTDGGAYTPTPTSVTGNISGGVWGCFRVSSYSEIGMYINE